MAINRMGMQSWVRKDSLNFVKNVENLLYWKIFQRKYIDILMRQF
jgi:hypothetical protein